MQNHSPHVPALVDSLLWRFRRNARCRFLRTCRREAGTRSHRYRDAEGTASRWRRARESRDRIQASATAGADPAGSDENIILIPPRRFTLEQAIDYIQDDELLEVTPGSIRLRKRLLTENERKRSERKI